MKANGLKVVDFAMSLNDIEQGPLANSKPHFVALGVELVQISGLNIPLPESIKEALEKMASAKVLGRTNAAAYQQFALDRKSTRLNSSHSQISYAVFCLKKKKNNKAST